MVDRVTIIKGAIMTHTGRWVRPTDIRQDDISIRDIAHSLSNSCRFSGHTSEFYSVAQHSVLVAATVVARDGDQQDAFCGLMHDASEAYLIDMPSPLKHETPFGEMYKESESTAMLAIAECFGFQYPLPQIVLDADETLLVSEMAWFMPAITYQERPGNEPIGRVPRALPPREAKESFLKAFWMLRP